VGAYNAYLRGFTNYHTQLKEGLEKSIEYFEQAIARDPASAQAYVGMAFSYDMLAEYGYLRPDEAYPELKEAAPSKSMPPDPLTGPLSPAYRAARGRARHPRERPRRSIGP
jgi:tetratricopeptide (TPR) repeat protein